MRHATGAQAPTLVLTCEHATAVIPSLYRRLFAADRTVLTTHRAYDLGALPLARRIARRAGVPLYAGRASRLLVDLNRSLHHPRVFSAFTQALPADEREALLACYYLPHRQAVTAAIAATLRARGAQVLHVSVHSFTPVLDGEVRRADIGLLFDPGRPREVVAARAWKDALRVLEPRLRVRFNYPYRGTSDGLTTALRRQFGPHRYAGVELEINQRLLDGAAFAPWVAQALLRSLGFVR